jgi:hypothetical protein
MIDFCPMNAYIVWKLIHNGTATMRSRDDFYLIAEETYSYIGLYTILKTRYALP